MYDKSKGYRFLFGPVPSRRLGRSLGIDIVPSKVCSLNCVYCEVGKTTQCAITRQRFNNPNEVISEFSEHYPPFAQKLDIVTITGSGEPTLCSDLGLLISEIKKISSIPVGVLTNSTLFTDPQVRAELMEADVVVPSIDAATPEVFRKICIPHPSLDISAINEALVTFSNEYKGRLLIEILLCEGINDNFEELGKIADIISRCRYEKVQLNTVHRPPAFSSARSVGSAFLLEAALFLSQRGISVEPVSNYIKDFSGGSMTRAELERLITMRPCSVKDISMVFGVPSSEVEAILAQIPAERLEIRDMSGENFYFMK
ncbi:radical SAM protein [Seleniivibrio woodruffii]|uniref:Wyosine [tRNA(Phe)-imidazoG37] synthetase (Radical SAM superfamily) n=1 Tax=Seleniivibrio woodruffii TaxID=1078050 RepID=A0A4V2PSD9_9BACT|nr:radical SAM protein [Seleniivibrio woodruffii]TCK62121.1 wyosine [tRNA(Phe)-imidazoG37] synthetase (radical SAM superfamily) [Seleniivibrio woodruffii]TVZ34762.1 wyosine [tRNA(Phe)-imidazoG37] synthetase (radical SAM superfamily) [Seleniivibrio woodruffii]